EPTNSTVSQLIPEKSNQGNRGLWSCAPAALAANGSQVRKVTSKSTQADNRDEPSGRLVFMNILLSTGSFS
ncbi:mCG1036931, isoform CRA_c, partial [Mus musculus]